MYVSFLKKLKPNLCKRRQLPAEEREKQQSRWVGSPTPSIPYALSTSGMVVALAVMAWKCLICVTGTESPVVVVLSGSMEPGFQRGDILFLNMGKEPIRAGEIVVFNFNRSEIPIVHRVIELHERQDTREISILTKGDNNDENDRVLYAKGHLWLQKQHIMGRAIGFLPYVGWITIVLTEIPVLKYLLIGALGLFALTSKE